MGEIPNKLFYKIGEVCEYTDTQPYVLRFWESEFPLLAPQKNRSGQRIYSRDDIELVFRIKKLLYDEEYTIAGARKRLEQEAGADVEEKAARGAKRSGARGSKRVDPSREEARAMRQRPARQKPSEEHVPPPPAPVVTRPRTESREIESLERRLADMEQRWRRAEIALEAAEEARNEIEERCRRAAARIEAALAAVAKLRERSEGR